MAEEGLLISAAQLHAGDRVDGWPHPEVWERASRCCAPGFSYAGCARLIRGLVKDEQPVCALSLWEAEGLYFRWERTPPGAWHEIVLRLGPAGDATRWITLTMDADGGLSATLVQVTADGQRVAQPWPASSTLSHKMNTQARPGVLHSERVQQVVLRIPSAALATLNWPAPVPGQQWRVDFRVTTKHLEAPPRLRTSGWSPSADASESAPAGTLTLREQRARRISVTVLRALTTDGGQVVDGVFDGGVVPADGQPGIEQPAQQPGVSDSTSSLPQRGDQGAMLLRPQVRWEGLRILRSGGADAAESEALLHRYLRRYTGRVRHCVERRWREAGRLIGTLTWELERGPEGRVRRVALLSDSIEDAALHRCISRRLRRIRLPNGEGNLVFQATTVIRRREAERSTPAR